MAKHLILVYLLIIFQTTLALTCYKCDSSAGTKCTYGSFDNETHSFDYETVECEEESKECLKIFARSTIGVEYVARGCMSPSKGSCLSVVESSGFFAGVDNMEKIDCYLCNVDKCNAELHTRTV